MSLTQDCPCGSGGALAHCCGPILGGEAPAPTAEALMRSRYSAFVLDNTAYLRESWHPSTRPAALAPGEGPNWRGLTIIAATGAAEDDTGEVEFVARFEENGRKGVLHETSRFVREGGRWYYLSGEIHPAPGRNAPCPCGSGGKFKRCCGMN
ncbi:YchJ family protein [Alkalilimnicola sp. S0819]|uniref:YchJ family protein n=1 Tax=Alkalilimnicola sp. S0819 TaxID=2613922 RepID=UPI001261AE9A|nr:YchJ family metal-binding protein [Alkalilimnicola sp. S0819]KAB7624141.1 hypothetical protein F3N43_07060 [Alkalilimnicola sp. S0819]MPQ16394.1 hypothetical protein [Alkalilimnicola sp. S0819]